MTVNVPDLSNSSIYHETKEPAKDNKAAELNLAVISPGLEPHGTVRSTKRARIVGVALELYYSKISLMSVGSKIEFFEFFKVWSGQDDDASKDCETRDDQESVGKESAKTVWKILGHCLLGPKQDKELIGVARAACRSLYSRSLHDINPQAILATS
ncbi:hypothetical protein NC652_011905 [Populus alba x Populus x berolinensis]|nr:hypothetical protein NC652_011905 [Populus alba x Populus x berolinensis]